MSAADPAQARRAAAVTGPPTARRSGRAAPSPLLAPDLHQRPSMGGRTVLPKLAVRVDEAELRSCVPAQVEPCHGPTQWPHPSHISSLQLGHGGIPRMN
jgi:hypothetical protein